MPKYTPQTASYITIHGVRTRRNLHARNRLRISRQNGRCCTHLRFGWKRVPARYIKYASHGRSETAAYLTSCSSRSFSPSERPTALFDKRFYFDYIGAPYYPVPVTHADVIGQSLSPLYKRSKWRSSMQCTCEGTDSMWVESVA